MGIQALLFALLFSPFLLTNTVNGISKTTVSIFNILPDELKLTIHCKSKNDDLGIHELRSNESFAWSFRDNFFDTTLFFCGFSWRDASLSFDIYKATRDRFRCPLNCTWVANYDGVYGYSENDGGDDIIFRWPKNLHQIHMLNY
ncbi:Self-incompatibility protein [Trema orientale]|uniref:S-protein homolog n=1 Tax=Trema orientale TaxID=63057 RepID=A0A2P5G040_TREOI|nr:Self-incompatibility protein [Trema orientale]